MNIVIVGQGAMGLLWYHNIGQIIKSNREYSETQLHLLDSKNSASGKPDINKKNPQYTVTDHDNLKHYGKINYAQTESIQAADIIIFCLKSFQISTALNEISEKLKNDAIIILAHNGMGTLEELPQNIVRKHNIYALLTTHGSLRTTPLTIYHTGVGTTDIGLLSGSADLAQQHSLTQLLNSALPPVLYHKKIKQKQWLKLAINCVINPLTAINNINNGQINNAEYSQTTTVLLEEVTNVASAEGIILDLIELKERVKKVAGATSKNSSSMRCDIQGNRMTEIDYINGYIHHLGIKHDIATPENTKMWQKIKKLETKT